MSFQASCPACGSPVSFDVVNSVVTICPSCHSAVGRADGKLQNLGKVADLVQTDSPLQCGLRGKFKGVPFEVIGRTQIRHSAGGVWDEWFLAFRGGKRWGWFAEAQGRYYLTFEQDIPEDAQIPPLSELDVEDTISIPKMGLAKVIEIGEGTVISAEGEIPYPVKPGELVSFADLSGGGRKFATLDESNGQRTLYAGGQVTLKELGLDAALSRDREERRVAAVQVNCPNCGGPLDLKAPDQTLRVACPFCASMLACNHGKLEFLQALGKKKIEPVIPLGAKGTFSPEVVNTDWEGPQELTVIGFLHRKVTYEGLDYSWHEYLLYKPRLPFYWLILNNGHWSFGQSIPAGDVSAGPTNARYGGKRFKIYDRGEPQVNYVLGECYWEVSIGETVKSSDYIAPPDMLSRETNLNPSPLKKNAESKLDKKNREINYTVSRYVPGEEIEKAFGKLDYTKPYGVAPNQPYPYSGIYKHWFLMIVVSLLLVLIAFATSKNKLVSTTTKQFQPGELASLLSDPFELKGGDNVAVNVYGNQWVYVSGKFLDENEQPVPNSDFGVYSGETVYLSSIPSGTYQVQFNATWQTPSSASPSFSLRIFQDQAHLSVPMVWLFLAVMGLPICIVLHHWSFDARRWKDSDFSPYNTE